MADVRGSEQEQSTKRLRSQTLDTEEEFPSLLRETQGDEDDTRLPPLQSEQSKSLILRQSEPLPLRLLKMQNQQLPDSMTDLKIQCSDGSIRVHRFLLSVYSNLVKCKSTSETELDFPEFDVRSMAKIIFMFYVGATMTTLALRQNLVRILNKLNCPEDRIEFSVPLKHSKSYEEIHFHQLGDHRLRVEGNNAFECFLTIRGDIVADNISNNRSISTPYLSPQSTAGPSNSLQKRPVLIFCHECKSGKFFRNYQEVRDHVLKFHVGNTNADFTMTRPMNLGNRFDFWPRPELEVAINPPFIFRNSAHTRALIVDQTGSPDPKPDKPTERNTSEISARQKNILQPIPTNLKHNQDDVNEPVKASDNASQVFPARGVGEYKPAPAPLFTIPEIVELLQITLNPMNNRTSDSTGNDPENQPIQFSQVPPTPTPTPGGLRGSQNPSTSTFNAISDPPNVLGGPDPTQSSTDDSTDDCTDDSTDDTDESTDWSDSDSSAESADTKTE